MCSVNTQVLAQITTRSNGTQIPSDCECGLLLFQDVLRMPSLIGLVEGVPQNSEFRANHIRVVYTLDPKASSKEP